MSTAGVKYYVTALIKDTFDKARYALFHFCRKQFLRGRCYIYQDEHDLLGSLASIPPP